MADRPIIFSAPMVRALLEGRKTQTRRVLKLAGRSPEFIGPRGCEADPTCWGWETPDGYFITVEGDEKDHAPEWRNGWRDWAGAYAPGNRLWVRESITRQETDQGVGYQTYAADGSKVWPLTQWFHRRNAVPSIHMPRWASRLTLTVTDVRVQRLQDISEEDAVAEGVDAISMEDVPRQAAMSRRSDFGALWNSLHGAGAWDANPWIIALTFTVQRGNIDSGGVTA